MAWSISRCDVLGRVVLQADDGGAEDADAVLAQFAGEGERVGAVELGVARVRRFEAHPDPGDAEFDQLLHRVLADGVGGGEDVERPSLAVALHVFEQLHRARLLQQEVLVHDEEGADVERLLGFAHDAGTTRRRFRRSSELAFAAEERGGGAEVAAHGAADRRDDGRGDCAFRTRQRESHDAVAEAADDRRVHDRRVRILAQKPSHPGDAFAFDDVVGVDHLLDAGDGGHVAADHDGRFRRELPHDAAHLPYFADIHDDGRDADDVVVRFRAVPSRTLPGSGKSSTVEGAGMFDWIIMMPQVRWNIRRESAPCARVTWLWYNSIGLIEREPKSSSCA